MRRQAARSAAGPLAAVGADVGARLVGRLILLRGRPRRGIGEGEDTQRQGEHQEQSRARVAQRAPGELSRAQRRDDLASAADQRLKADGQERQDAQREDAAGKQADGRRRHQQRVKAQAALDRVRVSGAP